MRPVKLSHAVYMMPVALEDAAHLYLSEDEVARIAALLARDPSSGRKGQCYWSKVFGEVTARYTWELTGGELEVYLLRLVRSRRRPRDLSEAQDVAKRLVVSVIQKKVNDLLEAGE